MSTTADDIDPVGRRVPFAVTEITPEAQEAAVRVLRSGWVTTGPEVVEFERELAEWVGAEHGVAVASCTAAIEISLQALQLRPGSKVLTSAMTFCGAVQAIIHAGHQPVLVDIDPVTLMPNAATTAEAACRAGGADAMIVLHYAGYPAPVAELAAAAGLSPSRVIEDAAHALATRVGDRLVGSLSAATCFSFYATKNLPIGEGGMITTDDAALADYMRRARLHGMSKNAWQRYLPGGSWRYEVDVPGHKANMTDVQAAIGRAQLHHVWHWQERRELLARRYDRHLGCIDGLSTPARPVDGRHAWHLYVVQVEQTFGVHRDGVLAALSERGVDCSVHFVPIHHHPYFKRVIGEAGSELAETDAAAGRVLSLPMHPGLSYDDIDFVCQALLDVAKAARRAATSAHVTASGPSAPVFRSRTSLRTLIVGAGEAGRSVARDLLHSPDFGLVPIGFLDDRPQADTIDDVPVLGSIADLSRIAAEHPVDVVIVAIPSLGQGEIRRLAKQALAAGVIVRYLPSFVAALERDVRVSDLRRLRVDLLLGREEMRVVRSSSRSVVQGRRVLVTGAGGSIGSELCRQIDGFRPSALYLLDHDESNLHRLQLELEGHGLLQSDGLIIADIRDRRRMHQVFQDLKPEVVFHTAAHKHLPLLERHPCEGVKSNVLGTEQLIEAALAAGTETFVNISTDKAADPTSVLGATKRLAEMIVARRAGTGMKVASVRFGNVLGSRGSFLSVLAEQIEKGEAITVTHPDVTRFFMTVEEAVGLVIEAAGMAEGGETFVLDMGEPVKIIDLVRNYVAQLHLDDSDVTIRYTGLRPGEKLNEALFSALEERRPTAHPKIWATSFPPVVDSFQTGLERLYQAADQNQPDEVRRCLAELVPYYHAGTVDDTTAAGALAAPYPDGF